MGLAFSHEGGWGGTWRRGVKKCASTCWDLVTRSPPDQNSGGWWRISEHGVRAGRPHAVHVTASRKAWSGAWHVTSMHAEVWSGGTVQGALEQWVSHQGCKLRPQHGREDLQRDLRSSHRRSGQSNSAKYPSSSRKSGNLDFMWTFLIHNSKQLFIDWLVIENWIQSMCGQLSTGPLVAQMLKWSWR